MSQPLPPLPPTTPRLARFRRLARRFLPAFESREPWSQAGNSNLGRMLDGEPVLDGGRLTRSEGQLPGELAEIVGLGRRRGRLAGAHLDVAVGGDRDVVVHAHRDLAVAMVLDRDLVADVDRPGPAEQGLARAAAAQLPLDLDLVVHAELDLELLAGGDRAQVGLADELGAVEDPGPP